MSLLEQIDADLLEAIKSRNELTRDTLRFLKSSLKNAELTNNHQALTDEQVVGVIQKEVKRRNEAIAAYGQASKPELAESEKKEAEILQKYLPSQKSETEIQAIITEYLAQNPTTPAEFGRAMGALGQQLKGQADLGLVSRLLKTAIGS